MKKSNRTIQNCIEMDGPVWRAAIIVACMQDHADLRDVPVAQWSVRFNGTDGVMTVQTPHVGTWPTEEEADHGGQRHRRAVFQRGGQRLHAEA